MSTDRPGVGRARARPTRTVMTARARAAGPVAPTCRQRHRSGRDESGVISLEAVWVLPAVLLLILGLILAMGLVRDVLLLHEAARHGARVAATTTGTEQVVAASREAAPELDLTVHVRPAVRSDGDVVTVQVHATRRIGPVTHPMSARAVARVEPAVRPMGPGQGSIQGPVAP